MARRASVGEPGRALPPAPARRRRPTRTSAPRPARRVRPSRNSDLQAVMAEDHGGSSSDGARVRYLVGVPGGSPPSGRSFRCAGRTWAYRVRHQTSFAPRRARAGGSTPLALAEARHLEGSPLRGSASSARPTSRARRGRPSAARCVVIHVPGHGEARLRRALRVTTPARRPDVHRRRHRFPSRAAGERHRRGHPAARRGERAGVRRRGEERFRPLGKGHEGRPRSSRSLPTGPSRAGTRPPSACTAIGRRRSSDGASRVSFTAEDTEAQACPTRCCAPRSPRGQVGEKRLLASSGATDHGSDPPRFVSASPEARARRSAGSSWRRATTPQRHQSEVGARPFCSTRSSAKGAFSRP